MSQLYPFGRRSGPSMKKIEFNNLMIFLGSKLLEIGEVALEKKTIK